MSSNSPIRSAPVRPWPVLLAVGPGIVLAAGVIGSGELINTPLQAARFGFVLLWAVLLSCVIKYFLQVEVGRYCLVHNQTVFEALSPFPGPRLRKTSWLVWVFMGGWLLAQVGSSGLVGAMAGLLHGIQPLSSDAIGSVQIWGVAVAVGVQLLLWRGLYGRLEKIMIGLALLLSLSAVVGLVMLQGTPFRVSGADLRSGLGFSLGETDVRLAAFAVISLIGALGVSGSELVVYPYWVLEKGYGRRLGPRDSEGWLERARGWIGILKLDAGVATLLATVVTAGYFILGAAILFPLGKTPAGIGVVDQISSIFTESYGPWSKSIFLVSAMATLLSTLLAATAVNGRIITDFLCSLGLVDRSRPQAVRGSQQVVQTAFLLSVLTLFLLVPTRPALMVLMSHYIIGVLGTPLATIAICWLAFRTERPLRMSRPVAVLLLASAGVIIGCVAFGLAVQAGFIR